MVSAEPGAGQDAPRSEVHGEDRHVLRIGRPAIGRLGPLVIGQRLRRRIRAARGLRLGLGFNPAALPARHLLGAESAGSVNRACLAAYFSPKCHKLQLRDAAACRFRGQRDGAAGRADCPLRASMYRCSYKADASVHRRRPACCTPSLDGARSANSSRRRAPWPLGVSPTLFEDRKVCKEFGKSADVDSTMPCCRRSFRIGSA
mmetsp:Transcript_1645/g.4582  ORF Transcript_1645/g.4582 Transcript_1645/m.4582 type:complete len:203 (-) Transcript_1645:3-611(-)